ncbi:putative sodium-dependent multivitamin transporter [Leptopilina boulardi]|uniref:putative sodium-dependent multivitamin transporter n=1 Tax=Leptopilina boulardi TaxID=63433 RepID=UPI0021F625A1|nr:putative sodium-dependent multivitamin transporter [Leptopilina boulardi]XP_051158288.1 putative sodium-dependent multivitamin transporter [Leptopilina boulardi]XP_051158289.1 putative sodium-dependent multivitamin transporter [Leptopilina boulardi]XP_051158290.1 putative sodium-dependent multivitamin transporter [Leptopilina boulardi]
MSFTLSWPDYIVMGIVLVISSGIGIYYRFTGGRQKTAEEYYSANRSMSVGPLAIALTVSFMSAISFLGVSAEIYTRGTQFTMWYAGFAFGTPIVAYFYLPVFWELQTKSVTEYLEKRFGPTCRRMASVANALQLILYTGVVLYAPSLALEATTGLSRTLSILLIGIICTFYSTIGGIKAVLITDVFQGILMFAALIGIIGVAVYEVDGGFFNVWTISDKGQRIEFFDFRIDPTIRHNFWGLTFGGAIVCISFYGTSQIQVQRFLTVKSLKEARLALFLNWPLLMGLGFLISFTGLALYAVYSKCDPVSSGEIDSYDKIMPYFAVDKMSKFPGLMGLFIAGIFSASLSTISAVLNSLSAVILEDYIKPFYKKKDKTLSDAKVTLLGKFFAITSGMICLGVSFIVGNFGSLIEAAIAFSAVFTGPLLGTFTLGMFTETANEIGTLIGFLSSILFMFWIIFGGPGFPLPQLPFNNEDCNITLTNNSTILDLKLENSSTFFLYRISYMWYAPLGTTLTLIIGWVFSLIIYKISATQNSSTKIDPKLFTPFVANRIRKRLNKNNKTSQVFVLESNNSLQMT